jgi:hypothetical protein
MTPDPSENQKDVGQFNAWLHNIGQTRVPQRPPAGGPPSAAPRPIPKPAVPPGGGILGNVDSDVDDVFGRIMTDGPMAAPPPAPGAAVPRQAPQAQPPPASRPEPPKAPPSRADVDRIIAAAQAQLRPTTTPQPVPQVAQRPSLPTAPPAAPAQPQSIFGRPVAQPQAPRPAPPTVAPVMTEMPAIEIPAPPAPMAHPAAGVGDPAQIAQLTHTHQQELARVENSFLETKNQLQKQVKDIQLKYQEQRTKWENVLADLRIRNDELLRRNQELEQQTEQMSERHHQLIQEYADLRGQTGSTGAAPQPQDAQLPEEIGVAQGEIMKGEFKIPEIDVPVQAAGAITIEAPSPVPETAASHERSFEIAAPQAVPIRSASEASFQTPGEPPAEPPSPAEADDLLAELEALEKEMKDIGGK